MLKGIFCPKLKWKSFTTFMLIVNLIMFIFCLTGGIKFDGTFLQADKVKWFDKMDIQPDLVVNKGQAWRLVTSFVISTDFSNFLLS